ncbi:ubiquinol-cytochrome C chaperone [Acuticoccus sp. M5D2P5]|uniref:ubiquinol-cytochrome C chaperone family protein n=1 Tax=Acuticoccus kalidii TaxID=2910977 RepID=UPI001F37E776|nr:ubiquinol-cytochrome C chaperone family protein [Acuticoccus kalidii]MCF3936361.1 ubiquinol-cytochrome C chaperone [Acuticoccus kalidii]
MKRKGLIAMLRFFFKSKPDAAVRALYDRAVAQARLPVFYQKYGVPDTLDGRFDMVVFHVSPLIDGLRHPDGTVTPDGQALFDTFVDDMEQNLRGMGVGDLTVPKRMKKFGAAFYGRFDAYRKSVADPDRLAATIARNVLGDEGRATTPQARALAAYYLAVVDAVRAADDMTREFAFPDPHAPAVLPSAPSPVEAIL